MFYGIIQKVNLTENLPFQTFLQKEYILWESEQLVDSPELVVNFIISLTELFNSIVNKDLRHVYVSSADGLTAYFLATFNSKEEWENFYNSPKFHEFLPHKVALYSAAGWVDQGYRMITSLPNDVFVIENTFVIESPEKAEELWNQAQPI